MTDPKRKLTFQKEKGLGKLRLRFDDGELKIRLSKHRDSYSLKREEAQELALWLSAWSLKLIDTAAKDSARAEAARAEGAADGAKSDGGNEPREATKDEKRKKRKKGRKSKKAVAVADEPHAIADSQQAN